jgi:hypothetical protein
MVRSTSLLQVALKLPFILYQSRPLLQCTLCQSETMIQLAHPGLTTLAAMAL